MRSYILIAMHSSNKKDSAIIEMSACIFVLIVKERAFSSSALFIMFGEMRDIMNKLLRYLLFPQSGVLAIRGDSLIGEKVVQK